MQCHVTSWIVQVPLAQKMMIAKANIAGKFVICATQMMESMIEHPYPTRAEMTDIANAAWDGADAVMLSGETANGKQPATAVQVMASIARQAEIGVNHNHEYNFVRSFTPKPVGTVEAVVSTLAKSAVDISPGLIVVFSESGKMARLVAKYRPSAPVLVVTSNASLSRACSAYFSTYAMLLDAPMANRGEMAAALTRALEYAVSSGLCVPGKEVVVLASTAATASGVGRGTERELFVTVAPGTLQFEALGALSPNLHTAAEAKWLAKTISLRATNLNLDMIMRESSVRCCDPSSPSAPFSLALACSCVSTANSIRMFASFSTGAKDMWVPAGGTQNQDCGNSRPELQGCWRHPAHG